MAYFHLGLTETNKQASVNVAEISIAASSFFNLDQVNKWVNDTPTIHMSYTCYNYRIPPQ